MKYRVEGEHSARTSVVHGDYEGKADVIDHITVEFTWDIRKSRFVGLVTVKDGKSELKNLKSDYPGGCSMRPIPGAKEDVVLHVAPVEPAILGMPSMAKGGPISVSADAKSFSMKGAENWTWTYTPAILQ